METINTPKSSNIKSVSWENNRLMVEFKQGGVYEYSGVTRPEFKLFENVPSAGKYFLSAIKPNHSCRKIG